MIVSVVSEAERRLEQARARVHALFDEIQAARGFGDWDGLRNAQQEVYAAERELARVAGDEYAVELDLPLRWDTGAPMPHLLADGRRAYLLFYLADVDPGWDGTSVG